MFASSEASAACLVFNVRLFNALRESRQSASGHDFGFAVGRPAPIHTIQDGESRSRNRSFVPVAEPSRSMNAVVEAGCTGS
jgi:hypothetical protein